MQLTNIMKSLGVFSGNIFSLNSVPYHGTCYIAQWHFCVTGSCMVIPLHEKYMVSHILFAIFLTGSK